MIADTIPALRTLSSDEKILLAAELWRDAVGAGGADPDPRLVAALSERLTYYRGNSEDVSSWEHVRSRISRVRNSADA